MQDSKNGVGDKVVSHVKWQTIYQASFVISILRDKNIPTMGRPM